MSISITSDRRSALGKYALLCGANAKIQPADPIARFNKNKLSREMGEIYAAELGGDRIAGVLDAEIRAADNTSVSLGTLSGTLVSQRTLELFRLQFPEFSRVYTDFSAEPGLFKQAEMTRVVVVPGLQNYDATMVNGRPNGWINVANTPTAIDVPITLDEHVGIPIVFDANTLASTGRKLFEERARPRLMRSPKGLSRKSMPSSRRQISTLMPR